MRALHIKKILLVVSILIITLIVFTMMTSRKPVDFTAQVKPIINKNCISCHGGVRQKAGFSLLFREEALANTESGKPAIIPGDPDNSEMIRRLSLNDPEERMPYKHDPLGKEDIDVLRRWIAEGAQWGEHWAYVPLKETPVPVSTSNLFNADKNINSPIDLFISEKLKENKLTPSPKADKPTLLRRVSLDIIGLPAPPSIASKFLNDNSENAYAELVDSLLASPHYGEKWTAMWLDLARYADTKGYEADKFRNIWHYRDWLIHAFNEDKPYDQFLTEQIAGDLMPEATDDQYVATAFNRNSMTNDEGGTDNEEFRASAIFDRVNTTWDGLMGTTFSCVQCHSHPYDPFKHEDYYAFMAFFNDTRDEDTEADYPLLRHLNDTLQQELSATVNWLEKNASPQKAKEAYTFIKTWQPAYNGSRCDSFTNSAFSTWVILRDQAICRLKAVDLNKKDHLIFRYSGMVGGGVWKIHLDNADGEVIASIPLPQTKSGWQWQIAEAALKPSGGVRDLYFTYSNPNLTSPIQSGARLDWLHFTEQFPGKDKSGYTATKNSFWKLINAKTPTTPVMMDNPSFMHRETYVFERGNWMVKGDKVTPGVPASLNPFPEDAPRNRLGLAKWLTAKKNPLTARTMTNRIWEQLFGTGIAETLEDLGSQGIPPTHAELLDWLSFHFMIDDQWSIKKLIRKIVMSGVYQQDSKVSEELLEKDPNNIYYARFPRIRLSAEQVRDQALSISGLMCDKMYGPSVFPYQPKGLWLSPYNSADWEQSAGEDQYRRAVYTFWKRSAPYPSMIAFDGVARDLCTARRIRTNTPLQALATLNDSAFVEMARNFAFRMQREAGQDVKQQIQAGFKLAVQRTIDNRSLQVLTTLYNTALEQFRNDPERTCQMMGGMHANTNAETAALTVVANAILNLNEVVTKT